MEPYISIVIPVYNEEESIEALYKELKSVLDNIKKTYEIIFVDDGSTDKSFEILEKLHNEDKKVKVIKFRRNFGKSSAIDAGFKNARGEIVFTMDADLQDDPKEIPRFLDKINEGFDLVVGWKYNRKDPYTKRIPSKIFNYLLMYLTGINIHDSNCCFKAYKKNVTDTLSIYGELHRYIPVLVHWKGFKITEIRVNHRPRMYGKSKYGVMRLFKGFLDLITVKFLTAYAGSPLYLFGTSGFIFSIIGFLAGLYLLYEKYILNKLIGERPLLLLSILFVLIGIQFIFMGLIGEMITSTNRINDYNIEITLD